MGFEIARQYELSFEGTAMHGATVVIRATPVGVLQQLRKGLAGGEDILHEAEFVKLLSEYLVSWDLEFDGAPLGTDVETITNQVEKVYLVVLYVEWLKAAAGISAPLATPSELSTEETPSNESSDLSSLLDIPQTPLE